MKHTLLEQLYSSCTHHAVVETSEEEMSAESQFVFHDSFSGFEGHFPGQPILPAIMQLAAVRLTVQRCTDKKYYLAGLSNNKFKGIVRPNDRLDIHISLNKTENGYTGSFSLSVENSGISTGKFELKNRG